MERLDIPTERGNILTGVLFPAENADTVVIAITGIHGNFYTNPFYYNIGETLNSGGVDFIYAQTNDAFSEIETFNTKTGKPETIGSWNERFSYTEFAGTFYAVEPRESDLYAPGSQRPRKGNYQPLQSQRISGKYQPPYALRRRK